MGSNCRKICEDFAISGFVASLMRGSQEYNTNRVFLNALILRISKCLQECLEIAVRVVLLI